MKKMFRSASSLLKEKDMVQQGMISKFAYKLRSLKVRRLVVIKTTFCATHHWPACPFKEVEYLQQIHRHQFHVVMKFPVEHEDRALEFIMLKEELTKFLREKYDGQFLGTKSCEQIAEELLHTFPKSTFTSVFEDDENGAEVTRCG